MNAIVGLAGMIAALMLTRRWKQNKRILLLLFNLGFLLVFSHKLFLFYLVYVALNYAGYLFLGQTASARRVWFLLLIAANVGAVVAGRFFEYGWSDSPVLGLFLTLGLLYNFLKVIDAYFFAYFFGKENRASLLDYANYILFVPTFTSGPILRFRDFMADTKKPYAVDAALFEESVKRIILGLFKKIVLVAWMSAVFNYVSAGELTVFHSVFLMVWFYIWIYFDFSGYSDIAIGFGRLMGYTVPENFKKPFLSPTLTQYWRNWHATLGDWFREHIFMFFSRKTPSKLTAAGLSMLIMVLIGLWHGFTWLYVAWGVYHGALLAIENLTNRSLVNKRKVSKTYFYLRCLLTQALVTFAVIVYLPSTKTDLILRIYRGLLTLPSF